MVGLLVGRIVLRKAGRLVHGPKWGYESDPARAEEVTIEAAKQVMKDIDGGIPELAPSSVTTHSSPSAQA